MILNHISAPGKLNCRCRGKGSFQYDFINSKSRVYNGILNLLEKCLRDVPYEIGGLRCWRKFLGARCTTDSGYMYGWIVGGCFACCSVTVVVNRLWCMVDARPIAITYFSYTSRERWPRHAMLLRYAKFHHREHRLRKI